MSWYRGFAMQDMFAANEITREAQTMLLEAWVKSQWISISLLGIQVGVSDVATLGSFGLVVISVWFFFAVRRENHTIGRLLRDTTELPAELQEMVYHSISSNMLFLDLKGQDQPITNLKEELSGKTYTGLRGLLSAIFFLPAIVVWFAVVTDVLSLISLKAAFRYPHDPILDSVKLSSLDQLTIIAMLSFAIIMAIAITLISLRVYKFEAAMGSILKEYRELIRLTPASVELDTDGYLKRHYRAEDAR